MASNISPEGYVFGSTPTPNVPFWDNSMNFSDITATAEIDNTAGNPAVELEVTKNNVGVGNLHFKFSGLKGQSGATGNVVAEATVDSNVGTPSVTVEKDYVGEDTSRFTFNFHNLKGADGEKGEKGEKGDPGTNGTNGTDGATPNISITATADALSSDNPTVTVSKTGTLEAPTFNLAFSGLKGKDGESGGGGGASYPNIYAANLPLLINRISNPSGSVLVPSEITKPTLVYLASSEAAASPVMIQSVDFNNSTITLSGTFDVSTDGGETYTEQTFTDKSFIVYSAYTETEANTASTIFTVSKNNNNYGVLLPFKDNIYSIISKHITYRFTTTSANEYGEAYIVCQDATTYADVIIKLKFSTPVVTNGWALEESMLLGKVDIIRKDSTGYYVLMEHTGNLRDKNNVIATSGKITYRIYVPATFNLASTYTVTYNTSLNNAILQSGLSEANIQSIIESCTEV